MLSRFSNDKQRLIKNIFSLAVLQGANYLLPLIIVPYLLRVIGVEYFGLISFATAVVMYFVMFSDYGFNLSATQKIAVNKHNKEKLNEIVSSILSIKFFIVLFSFFILLTILMVIPTFHEHYMVYICTFGMVIGQAMIPLWLFQGMETMKYMTYFNIFAKGLATVCIFLFVKDKGDFIYVPIFTSLGYIVSGVLSLYYAIKIFDLTLYIPNREKIIFYLKDGWHIFLSNLFVNLYSTTNTIVLGLLTNNVIVGYYSVAEKIIGAISGLFTPVTQALYPYLSTLHKEKNENYFFLLKKLVLIYLFVGFALSIVIYFFGEEIVALLTSKINYDIVRILQILVLVFALFPLGSLFTQAFIIQNRKDIFVKIVKITFFINIILLVPFIKLWSGIGLAIVVCIRQISSFGLNLFFLARINK